MRGTEGASGNPRSGERRAKQVSRDEEMACILAERIRGSGERKHPLQSVFRTRRSLAFPEEPVGGPGDHLLFRRAYPGPGTRCPPGAEDPGKGS